MGAAPDEVILFTSNTNGADALAHCSQFKTLLMKDLGHHHGAWLHYAEAGGQHAVSIMFHESVPGAAAYVRQARDLAVGVGDAVLHGIPLPQVVATWQKLRAGSPAH